MKKLNLRSKVKNGFLEIPVDFVDLYMPEASAEQLKVYLYLLRSSMDPAILLSVNDMADLFDVTPNRIAQALAYWESRGLLKLRFEDGDLSDIILLPIGTPEPGLSRPEAYSESFVTSRNDSRSADYQYNEAGNSASRTGAVSAAAVPAVAVSKETLAVGAVPAEAAPVGSMSAETSPVGAAPAAQPAVSEQKPANVHTLPIRNESPLLDLSVLDTDEAFTELLGLTEFYFNQPLNATQRNAVGTCYLLFNRQGDVIEYLLEYCLERLGKNHFSARYIEATARGWISDGYSTLQEIRTGTADRNSTVYQIMNAFGLKKRDPAKSESDYIAEWTKNFDLSIILEACSRTIAATHAPSFEYANTILNKWKSAGVRVPADITRLDEAHRARPKTSAAREQERPARKAGTYRNFDERTTDYDALIAEYYES